MAAIVVATDPGLWSERVFLMLCACCCSALSTACMLYLFASEATGWLDIARALRRGCLAGLGCTSLVDLQFAAALTITNVAFVWLILAIVEMIFLAGYPHSRELGEQGHGQGDGRRGEPSLRQALGWRIFGSTPEAGMAAPITRESCDASRQGSYLWRRAVAPRGDESL